MIRGISLNITHFAEISRWREIEYLDDIACAYEAMVRRGYRIKMIDGFEYVIDPSNLGWDTKTIEVRMQSNPPHGGLITDKNDALAAQKALTFLYLYQQVANGNLKKMKEAISFK